MLRTIQLVAVLLLLFAGAVYSQTAEEEPAAATEESQEGQAAEPEPPRSVMNISVENGLMSLEIENTDFGTAIRSVSEKAGFKIEGSSETFSKKLNTKFTGIETERAVQRLFSLVRESNYMMHYSPDGAISRIDIYGAAATVAAQPPTTTRSAASRQIPPISRPNITRPNLPAAQRQFPRRFGNVMSPQKPTPQQPQPEPTEEPEVVEEENVSETPYVAPQPKSTFPSRRR
jgi:hypothetical protein